MGRSQLIYNQTSARMRASRGGGGRGRGRGGRGTTNERRQGELQQREDFDQGITSTLPQPQTSPHLHQTSDIVKGQDQKYEEKAEQLLFLSQATSLSASASRTSAPPHMLEESEHHFLRAMSPSRADTEVLCAHMSQALQLSLTRAEQMRLPQHLVEIVYGSSEPSKKKPEQTPATPAAQEHPQKPPDLTISDSYSDSSNYFLAAGSSVDDDDYATQKYHHNNEADATIDSLLLSNIESMDTTNLLSSEDESRSRPNNIFEMMQSQVNIQAGQHQSYPHQKVDNVGNACCVDDTYNFANSSISDSAVQEDSLFPTTAPFTPTQSPHVVYSHHHYMDPTVSSVLKIHETVSPRNNAAPEVAGDSSMMEHWLDEILAASGETCEDIGENDSIQNQR